ncbi:disease resistance protein Pik-1-like [Dioscorea cayenensis subsp. rotundata]|uniref:Disease resistance protein Pik-1-like n=1 Tax=Dioscorea cayennensis subsp. rotundata TaxID=55577 RepID=A0AB40BAH4_DIOCR|nr:disease resistance protein Pik-1-like [Dioscorea cayenensis subsp. rotundata]
MVKQKMVMKLTMEDAKKHSKALKTAVSFSGVISAGLEGEAKDRLVVIGDGVDSISLTITLRKKMGHVELVSVSSYDEKKDGKKENNNNNNNKSKGEDTKYLVSSAGSFRGLLENQALPQLFEHQTYRSYRRFGAHY